MPTKPVATTTIVIDRIHPNPNQPRKYFDPQALQDLKDSMDKRGLINPISVFKSGEWDYTIIAGERRYRAAIWSGSLSRTSSDAAPTMIS